MLTQKKLESYFDRLFPLNRSITGKDYRKSLKILSEIIPFKFHDFKSGKKCFDWVIPNEWNVNNAYILTPNGEKIANFQDSNLHLMGYSVPVRKKISYKELKKRIYTIKNMPNAIPYVTSYYKKNWGFCLQYNIFKKLQKKGNYNVVIDSSLKKGYLRVGMCVIPGISKKEILISTYLCHPSMAVNELSGPLTALSLYKQLIKEKKFFYTIRFIICPETIGSIAILSKFCDYLKKNVIAGYVLTCIGVGNGYVYKKTRLGNSIVDKTMIQILKKQKKPFKIINFFPGGSDEKQYSSPGFNLPIGLLMGKIYGGYKEYHTSLDNKKLINFKEINQTASLYLKAMKIIDKFKNKQINKTPKFFVKKKGHEYYFSKVQKGMPFFSKKNNKLYPYIMEHKKISLSLYVSTIMEILNYSDGTNSLLDIAKKVKKKISYVTKVKNDLIRYNYLIPIHNKK